MRLKTLNNIQKSGYATLIYVEEEALSRSAARSTFGTRCSTGGIRKKEQQMTALLVHRQEEIE
jgi:hypothetical protein|nr:MAG TPA: hypothetical protein [Caudoviricetes sp.]